MTEKQTLNIEEVAELLGVNRQTVSIAAKTGGIPCVRMGKRMVFPRQAIERFLQTGAFNAGDQVTDPGALGRAVVRQLLISQRAAIDAQLAALGEDVQDGSPNTQHPIGRLHDVTR